MKIKLKHKEGDAPSELRRVLLIDDEQDVTDSLSMNLEATGEFEVKAINDPRQALDTAREFSPDVIVLDVVMPGMDGGDVQAALHADPTLKNTPIVMVTALVSNNDTSGGTVESGGVHMLAKPVRLETLLPLLRGSGGEG
jgi:CheY-like chemotaxis protein